MTSVQKRKLFQDWKDNLEERLAWYLFNIPESQILVLENGAWTTKLQDQK